MSMEDDCVHAVEIDGIYECGDANPVTLCIPGGNKCVKYEIVTKYVAEKTRNKLAKDHGRRCSTCTHFIKPTAVDVIVLDIKRNSLNPTGNEVDKFKRNMCECGNSVQPTRCNDYRKKWYMFWVRG